MNNQPNQINCQFCIQQQSKFIQKEIHKKYFEQFNFYFAKPITEILANVPVDHVILFKDQLYLHDENEYMKRFYQRDEQDPRLKLLNDFYTQQHKVPQPNLCKVNAHKFMEKRQNKLLKLHQKAQNSQNQQPITKKMIPDHIFSENYVESVSDSYPREQISWDSKSHDIYEISQSAAQQQSQAQNKQPQHCPILNVSGDQNRLFNCENDPDLDNLFSDINAQTSRHLSSITKIPLKKKPPPSSANGKKNLPPQQSIQPKIAIPPLKLQESAKSSTTTAPNNKSTSIQSLMKKYDQILQKRFQVKEILTERNETRHAAGFGSSCGIGIGETGSSKKQITDEMLLKLIQNMKKQKNKSDNYQFHACYKSVIPQGQNGPTQSCTFEKENEKKKKYQVYLPKQLKKNPSQMSSPTTVQKYNFHLSLQYLFSFYVTQVAFQSFHGSVTDEKIRNKSQFKQANPITRIGNWVLDTKVQGSLKRSFGIKYKYVLSVYFNILTTQKSNFNHEHQLRVYDFIHIKELRKTGRGQSVNTDFMQYHKLSQVYNPKVLKNKTFTESFPLSLKQTKHNFKNQLSALDFDNHQVDIKNHPFTFQEKTEQKTEATKKKFVFDDHQPTNQGELKKFINAMDEYIDFLNESQESTAHNSGDQGKIENLIFSKFNLIRQKHEELNKKYKTVQQNYKAQKYQNQILKQQILDLHQQMEEERTKNYHLSDHNNRLKQKYKELSMRNQFLQNSFLQERLKFENSKLINFQQSVSIEDNTSQQQLTHETNETNEDQEQVTRFLKSQMRKLKQNNQQIDDYSRLYKKFSEHNNEDF